MRATILEFGRDRGARDKAVLLGELNIDLSALQQRALPLELKKQFKQLVAVVDRYPFICTSH